VCQSINRIDQDAKWTVKWSENQTLFSIKTYWGELQKRGYLKIWLKSIRGDGKVFRVLENKSVLHIEQVLFAISFAIGIILWFAISFVISSAPP